MRNIININDSWTFIKESQQIENISKTNGKAINLPHTWNGIDGQDGGNDYVRNSFWYRKIIKASDIPNSDRVFLEFKGVNSSADVYVDSKFIGHHDGGYSTFRFDITDHIKDIFEILVNVDNKANETVYPQKADFTFYGGIYRDVNIITVSNNHFDLLHYGSQGVQAKTSVHETKGLLDITSYIVGEGDVHIKLYDQEGIIVYQGDSNPTIEINNIHLWQGIKNPYLYQLEVQLINNDKIEDLVSFNLGFRTFEMDPDKGFILNGESYPLRGVCRHQDRPNIGNALKKEHHEEDMTLIKSVGANTIRLAHYQHDDYFYDLCDAYGMVVWAEIPYISKHMKMGNDNAVSQMKELITQQFHHPSIVTWGISNEITISKTGKDCLLFHKELNELCHSYDDSRKTVIADYMPARIKNKLNRIPDIVSYNLYFGWYLPFTSLAGWKLNRYHKKYPKEIIGLSEYGAEGMTNIHNRIPRRGDNTEAYQAIYHEKMLDIINQRKYLWATHVWNMFDFAADARNQGGEPGMNHKGLITFDRKTKKDAFYIYKAHWSDEPFVHICDKHYEKRTGKKTTVKVYSNLKSLKLYHNDSLVFDGNIDKIAIIKIIMAKENKILAISADYKDETIIYKVNKKPSEYKLKKQKNISWEK